MRLAEPIRDLLKNDFSRVYAFFSPSDKETILVESRLNSGITQDATYSYTHEMVTITIERNDINSLITDKDILIDILTQYPLTQTANFQIYFSKLLRELPPKEMGTNQYVWIGFFDMKANKEIKT